jgi:hypothetical protein
MPLQQNKTQTEIPCNIRLCFVEKSLRDFVLTYGVVRLNFVASIPICSASQATISEYAWGGRP